MNKIKLIIVAIGLLILTNCVNEQERKKCKQTCSTNSAVLFVVVDANRKSSCSTTSFPGSSDTVNSSAYQTCISSGSLTTTQVTSQYSSDCEKKCNKNLFSNLGL